MKMITHFSEAFRSEQLTPSNTYVCGRLGMCRFNEDGTADQPGLLLDIRDMNDTTEDKNGRELVCIGLSADTTQALLDVLQSLFSQAHFYDVEQQKAKMEEFFNELDAVAVKDRAE